MQRVSRGKVGFMSRQLFSGGNTRYGFYSFFDAVAPTSKEKRAIYIKGSSGCGKSTLMKKIGARLEEYGDRIDYIHCSYDPDSLDGLYDADLQLAIFDGTAPHIGDPTLPVAMDDYLDLTGCIDKKVRERKDELLACIGEKKALVDRAYQYIKAAYEIGEGNALLIRQAQSPAKLDRLFVALREKTFGNAGDAPKLPGMSRKYFATGIAPSGVVDYTDSLLTTGDIVALEGENGAGADLVLARLRDEAAVRGFSFECCYCALDPTKLEHLILPQLDISFTTVNRHHAPGAVPTSRLDLSDLVQAEKVAHVQGEIDENEQLFQTLLAKGVAALSASKPAHERVENMYLQYVDFQWLDDVCEKTSQKIDDLRGSIHGYIAT